MQNNISLYKNLNIVALNNNLIAPYRMWVLLRACDTQGKGYVDYKEFIKFIGKLELGYNHFYTALNSKESELFFSYLENANIIEYRGILNVCKAFDVKPGNFVRIQTDCLRNLRRFAAYCYASLFSEKPKNMSRDFIEALTGLSRQTQLNYEKIVGIKVIPNVANYQWSDAEKNNAEMRYNRETSLPCIRNLSEGKSSYHKVTKQGVYWQTTNTYTVSKEKVNHIRKMPSATLKLKGKVNNTGIAITGEHAGVLPTRLYLDNVPNNKKIYFTEQGESLINTKRIGHVVRPNNKRQPAMIHRYNPYGITAKKEGSISYAFIDNNFNVVIPTQIQQPIVNTIVEPIVNITIDPIVTTIVEPTTVIPIVVNVVVEQTQPIIQTQEITMTEESKYKKYFTIVKTKQNRFNETIHEIYWETYSQKYQVYGDSPLFASNLDELIDNFISNFTFTSDKEKDDFIFTLINNTIKLETAGYEYGKNSRIPLQSCLNGHGLHLLNLPQPTEKLLVS